MDVIMDGQLRTRTFRTFQEPEERSKFKGKVIPGRALAGAREPA
jgi:hypothetical protein